MLRRFRLIRAANELGQFRAALGIMMWSLVVFRFRV